MINNSKNFNFEAIGHYHSNAKYAYDAPRQANLSKSQGKIILNSNCNYEQALQDLSGFSHIWIIYVFHKNSNWKPLVNPPRGENKVGVFASRAPYRPNPIGMSCVEILGVSKKEILITASDLLDGTPILDIKPYLPYCDSIPEAKLGWIDEIPEEFQIEFSSIVQKQISWLNSHSVENLESFIFSQLSDNPFKSSKKRIRKDGKLQVLAYRTWRIYFEINIENHQIKVKHITSGYNNNEIADLEDKYQDKEIHKAFLELYN